MFSKRLANGRRHTLVLFRALLIPSRRKLLGRMVAFSRALPRQFELPLPAMMARLTPTVSAQKTGRLPDRNSPPLLEIRQLADAVAVWHFFSPLGICLRRSLLRYHFLRQAGLPVTIVFGARLKEDREGGGLGGHAWLALNDRPYHETPADYEGFVAMYIYPERDEG